MGCRVCGQIPTRDRLSNEKYVWCPTPHTEAKLRSIIENAGGKVARDQPTQSLRMSMPEMDLTNLFQHIERRFSQLEINETRVLELDCGKEPTLASIGDTTTFRQFMARHEARNLMQVLVEDRLDFYFQPIVKSADPTSVHAYECLLRPRDDSGEIIPNSEFFSLVKRANMLFQLDLAARRAALRQAAEHQGEFGLFINFTPTVVYDPDYCLKSTIALTRELGLPPQRITFEVTESEEMQDEKTLQRTLEVYRQEGFNVALDDLGSGFASLNLLHRLRPDVVKLDMELVRNVDHDPFKSVIAAKLLEAANALGVKTVAEGVETLEEYAWIKEHGATFVQGYLFGKPAPSPEQPVKVAVSLTPCFSANAADRPTVHAIN